MPALKGADIPPGNWARRSPHGRRPLSTVLCPACGTLLAQAVVDDGERYHSLCTPEARAEIRAIEQGRRLRVARPVLP